MRKQMDVVVDCVDDPVPCPECDQEMRKGMGVNLPTMPLSELKNNEYTTECFGQAYCENQECPRHSDVVFWAYTYSRRHRESSPVP